MSKRNKTIVQFVNNAKRTHGDTYDYSKSLYVNAHTKVCICCEYHGDFFQNPAKHENGQGCPDCAHISRRVMRTDTIIDFVDKSNKVHANKYDYSESVYVNSHTKIRIGCHYHGSFYQRPRSHVTGYGCPECGAEKSSAARTRTKSEFVEKAKMVHGDKYDYSKSEYKNSTTWLRIGCSTHGDFFQTPKIHLKGSGCQRCGYDSVSTKLLDTKAIFVLKANYAHGLKYDYSNSVYVNSFTKVSIVCPHHGNFQQNPASHIAGQGCPSCGIAEMSYKLSKTNNEFIKDAEKMHGKKYDYSKSFYVNSFVKVCIVCPAHGVFHQRPRDHIKSQGCPRCTHRGYSKVQIQWLNFVALYYGLEIQNAENGGEFNIPTTRYSADGFCKANNTVYEFHGDYWHGNPARFHAEDTNYISKKTFGELYATTLARENEIKKLGYKLVVMWESQWTKINRAIGRLQRKAK